MQLTIAEIIFEADTLVPSAYTASIRRPWPEAVAWLNAINQEFFDVVKVPSDARFQTVVGTSTYTLSSGIKEKNIDKVIAGRYKYKSLNYDDLQPSEQWFSYDEPTNTITLSPAPSQSNLTGVVRHYKSATTIFTTGGVDTQVPDAPEEYHWIYVLGLAEYAAKANEEDEKAQDFGTQYRNALNTAAKNYLGGANNA